MKPSIEDTMEACYQVDRIKNPLLNVIVVQLGEDAARMLYCLGWSKGHLTGLEAAKALLDD